MKLETMAHLTTIIGVPIAIIVPIAIAIAPWIQKKLKVWWGKTRDQTELTLEYKTKLGQSKTHSAGYAIGYLFIDYKTTHRKRFIHWRYEFLASFYKGIGKLRRFESIANVRWMNNFAKFNSERRDAGDSRDSYIYRETNVLAFYPIKEFDNTPDWADLRAIQFSLLDFFLIFRACATCLFASHMLYFTSWYYEFDPGGSLR